jgi:transcriptional regulator NrdR family protein
LTERPRKTLQQMQREADTAESSHGWSCRRCGCKRTKVVNTWINGDGSVRRKRVCDSCGQDFTHTTEVPCPTGFRVVVEDEEAEERAVA